MATDLRAFSDALSGVGCLCLGKTEQVQSGDRASGSRLPSTLRKRGLQEARAWPLGALFFQEEFSFAAFRLVSFPSGPLEQGHTLQASWALLRGQNNSPQFTGEDPVAQGHTEVKWGGGVSSPYLGIPDPCLLHIHAGPIEGGF